MLCNSCLPVLFLASCAGMDFQYWLLCNFLHNILLILLLFLKEVLACWTVSSDCSLIFCSLKSFRVWLSTPGKSVSTHLSFVWPWWGLLCFVLWDSFKWLSRLSSTDNSAFLFLLESLWENYISTILCFPFVSLFCSFFICSYLLLFEFFVFQVP